MSNAPKLFRNGEFELPMIAEPDGGFRVYAPLVATQLGHRDAATMIRVLADDEKVLVNGYTNSRTLLEQDVWYLTEPGFYRVVGQRNVNLIKDLKVREAVYRFQRWVFHEVIPAMVRGGYTTTLQPGVAWSWEAVAAQIRQRYGLDYLPNQITAGLRLAGWLKANECAPKSEHRHKFWHTGSAFALLPYALPELAADLITTLQGLEDPQACQYQLAIFPTPALRALDGGAA